MACTVEGSYGMYGNWLLFFVIALYGSAPRLLSKFNAARAICRSLFVHDVRLADSRAACTAGNSSATSTPMMAITTSSSTSVKALRCTNPWRGIEALLRLQCAPIELRNKPQVASIGGRIHF